MTTKNALELQWENKRSDSLQFLKLKVLQCNVECSIINIIFSALCYRFPFSISHQNWDLILDIQLYDIFLINSRTFLKNYWFWSNNFSMNVKHSNLFMILSRSSLQTKFFKPKALGTIFEILLPSGKMNFRYVVIWICTWFLEHFIFSPVGHIKTYIHTSYWIVAIYATFIDNFWLKNHGYF